MEEEKVTITETEVIARKIQLEEQYQSAQGMVAALGGVIQDCDWCLEKLATKEEAKKAELKQLAETKAKEEAEFEAAKKNKRKKRK